MASAFASQADHRPQLPVDPAQSTVFNPVPPTLTSIADTQSTREMRRDAINSTIQRKSEERRGADFAGDKQQRGPSPSTAAYSNEAKSSVIALPAMFETRQVEHRSVNTLQEWEGLVQTCEADYFTAKLRDLTNKTMLPEHAEISLDDVDPEHRHKVMPGALFHLFIGFTRRGGVRRRETFTYFRKYMPTAPGLGNELADLLDGFDDDDCE